MTSGEGPDHEGHDHDLKPTLLAFLVIISLGLVAGIVLSYVQAQRTGDRLAVLEEFVEGRGEQRDRENDAQDVRIKRAICDLLDQLPEGRLLDRPRAKYGCGPGLRPDEIPPAAEAP